ncbi:MAG: hypothetical protein CMK36_08695 [Porticoccaceae bacterium]|nr:hypothetical protein [Porticoccaceae bacterium]
MFDKSKKPINQKGESRANSPDGKLFKAVIGATVKVVGQIISAEDIQIDGNVEGSISAEEHKVFVSACGNLLADVRAHVVIIEGTVKGDITGLEKVVVCQSGNVLGNIDAPRVTLEDGAKFKGNIEMDPSVPPIFNARPGKLTSNASDGDEAVESS